MTRKIGWLRRFFFPGENASRGRRILPYAVLVVVMIGVLAVMTATWEVTNSTNFCGLTCHTMPPEYVTHGNSVHARLTCEDCHLGRASLPVLIYRKIDYGQGTFFSMVFHTYEYPIRASKMRPARDVCETCHYPEVFSADKVFDIKKYAPDDQNTPSTLYMILKTGGGSRRQGLGRGIHWHIENPVYFISTDPERQQIPYVKVQNPDGTTSEYVDVEASFDPSTVKPDQLQQMDCITCHNRAAHFIPQPEDAVNRLLGNGVISPEIPEIRSKAVEVLKEAYPTAADAQKAIDSLADFYKSSYADFYAGNKDLVDGAVGALQEVFKDSVFIDQKYNWDTHPNNLQHKDSPGCFRCHDGKHLSASGEAVRLECNLCHTIPEMVGKDRLVAEIPVNVGFEPDSHKSSSWIILHRDAFDGTCEGCHTVDDPGGTNNTSFCSNSACHGSAWTYAGFDAPKLKSTLAGQLKPQATAQPAETQGSKTPAVYTGGVDALFEKCTTCHNEDGPKGIDLTGYQAIMSDAGGTLVIPGDPENSLLIKVQGGAEPHFVQFSPEELDLIKAWIQAGAPEK